MKQPTIKQLLEEIQGLKKRIADLEARPPVVIHNHPPIQPSIFFPAPQTIPPGLPWRNGEVWCETIAADTLPLWNGPRNPDGSCAPIGSCGLTANGGGSSC